MTSENIRIDAQLLCGFQLDTVTVFLWVKDAVSYIVRNHPRAAAKNTVTVEVTEEGQTYTIPEELVRLQGVRKHGERGNIKQTHYDCDEYGNMTFWHKGNYDVEYLYVPAMPQTADSAIPIPGRYAEPIKYYVAARMRGRIYGQNDVEAQSYDALFWKYLDDADISFTNTNKRFRVMPPRY